MQIHVRHTIIPSSGLPLQVRAAHAGQHPRTAPLAPVPLLPPFALTTLLVVVVWQERRERFGREDGG
eukprot:49459-Eustigmatos_ZCMA.PRE.1